MKNFIADLLSYHNLSGATTSEALQTTFRAKKIFLPIFQYLESFFARDKGSTDRVLDQSVRFLDSLRVGLLFPQGQGLFNLAISLIDEISQKHP
jgi:hypothetical protein